MQTFLVLCFNRYYRSFDSDFTALLVAYHVWPALMEKDVVILKGEAVTKRGALVCTLRNILREVIGYKNTVLKFKKINSSLFAIWLELCISNIS